MTAAHSTDKVQGGTPVTTTLSPSYVATLRYLQAIDTDYSVKGIRTLKPESGLYIEINGSRDTWTTMRVVRVGSASKCIDVKVKPRTVYAERDGQPIIGGPVAGTAQESEEWFLARMKLLTRNERQGISGLRQ